MMVFCGHAFGALKTSRYLTYQPHTSHNLSTVTIPWGEYMQQIAVCYPSSIGYIFPIITDSDTKAQDLQISAYRQTVNRNLRTIGKRYRFSVVSTMSVTRASTGN